MTKATRSGAGFAGTRSNWDAHQVLVDIPRGWARGRAHGGDARRECIGAGRPAPLHLPIDKRKALGLPHYRLATSP